VRRTGERGGVVQVRPALVAGVRDFGRYRSGAICDGVLLWSVKR
jgi:ribosomal protein S28E/S33